MTALVFSREPGSREIALDGRLRVARCVPDLPLGWTVVAFVAASALDCAESDSVAGTASFGGAIAVGTAPAGAISALGLVAGVTGGWR